MKSHFTILSICCMLAVIFTQCQNSEDHPSDGIKTVHFPKSDVVKQTVEYKNGKKNGWLKEYYRNGVLKASQYYVNRTLDDTTRIYHTDGKLQIIRTYKNKLKHGCWRDYNKSGGLYSEVFFKNGFLDSVCSKYSYRSLHLLTRVNYKEGTKNGAEEKFYPDGKPQSKVYYDMGNLCKGGEEWYQNGEKINNDFKIYVSENDDVLLKNTLSYIVTLENPKPDDQVYQVVRPDSGNSVGAVFPLKKKDGRFMLEINVPPGGFVMEKITIAAYRKTPFKNTYIKTQSFNAASNNF